MNVRDLSGLAAGLAALLVSTALLAIPDQEPIDHATLSSRTFASVVADIDAGMQPGGRWHDLPVEEQNRVRSLLGSMTDTLEKAPTVDALSPNQQVIVFNSQEEVNAILTGREIRDRMECTRVKRTGSRIGHEIRCEVVAIDEDRRFHEVDVMRRAGVKPLRAE